MKRYFDMPEDKMTMLIEMDPIGMKYSAAEIEEKMKIKCNGLREIDKKEYDLLTEKYTAPEKHQINNRDDVSKIKRIIRKMTDEELRATIDRHSEQIISKGGEGIGSETKETFVKILRGACM